MTTSNSLNVRSQVELSILPSLLSIIMALGKERNKCTVAENSKYRETDRVNPVKLSLKSHPLWVTLYFLKENISNVNQILNFMVVRRDLNTILVLTNF